MKATPAGAVLNEGYTPYDRVKFQEVANTDPSGQGYPRVVEAGSDLKELGAYVMAVIDEGEQLITAIAANSVHVPSVDEPMSPLLTLPPVQMYSLYLASERIAAGYQRPSVN